MGVAVAFAVAVAATSVRDQFFEGEQDIMLDIRVGVLVDRHAGRGVGDEDDGVTVPHAGLGDGDDCG